MIVVTEIITIRKFDYIIYITYIMYINVIYNIICFVLEL